MVLKRELFRLLQDQNYFLNEARRLEGNVLRVYRSIVGEVRRKRIEADFYFGIFLPSYVRYDWNGVELVLRTSTAAADARYSSPKLIEVSSALVAYHELAHLNGADEEEADEIAFKKTAQIFGKEKVKAVELARERRYRQYLAFSRFEEVKEIEPFYAICGTRKTYVDETTSVYCSGIVRQFVKAKTGLELNEKLSLLVFNLALFIVKRKF